MKLPKSDIGLVKEVYQGVFPAVHQELKGWQEKAKQIPNEELRTQALSSIAHKTFHCEGGAILALAAGEKKNDVIRFIVAYQTISDYLDNLCDRSTSLDPDDFALLHQSMKDALCPTALTTNYYELREDQDDGGYLSGLVTTCQSVLKEIKRYDDIEPYLNKLCTYYCDLQIHKHVKWEERVNRLESWFNESKHQLPSDLSWYEFSACAGSTLGIFCLVSYGFRKDFTEQLATTIYDAYFPYVQGLHIMLDYFIDQEEDRDGNDLNFCFYYETEERMIERLCYFVEQANNDVKKLPDGKFHSMINQGLIGIYLADSKVKRQSAVRQYKRVLLRQCGRSAYFFYWNSKLYHAYKRMKKNSLG